MLRIQRSGTSLMPALSGVLSQADQAIEPVPYDAPTYQQVFDEAQTLCRARLSEDDCHRLFGYQPFLCPPKPRSITGEWWLWTGIGIVGGAVLVKLFL